MEQSDLVGPPLSTTITGTKLVDMLLETGAQIALKSVLQALEAAQKQHPAAPGLTIAIAFVQRDIAEAQIKTTRIVLGAAAKAGLPIESHALMSGLKGEVIEVTAVPGEPS